MQQPAKILLRAANKALPVFLMPKPLAEKIIRELPLERKEGEQFWWMTRDGRRRHKMSYKVFGQFGPSPSRCKEALMSGEYKDWIIQQSLATGIETSADIRDILIANVFIEKLTQTWLAGRISDQYQEYAMEVLVHTENLDGETQSRLAEKINYSVFVRLALNSLNLTSEKARKILVEALFLDIDFRDRIWGHPLESWLDLFDIGPTEPLGKFLGLDQIQKARRERTIN